MCLLNTQQRPADAEFREKGREAQRGWRWFRVSQQEGRSQNQRGGPLRHPAHFVPTPCCPWEVADNKGVGAGGGQPQGSRGTAPG